MLLAIGATGCQLLMPGTGFEDEFPSPSAIASYSKGAATLSIDGGQAVTLGRVAAGSGVDAAFGSHVRWSSADGWNLAISGAGSSPMFGESAYLTLDKIADGRHLTTYDPGRCIVTIDVADAKAIRGSATCKDVEWYDALEMQNFGGFASEPPDSGEPKFDAEITFEATP